LVLFYVLAGNLKAGRALVEEIQRKHPTAPMTNFVVILIGGCVVLYYRSILPYVIKEDPIWTVIHLVISFWLLSNITFNYFACVFTKPGSPPLSDIEKSKVAEASSNNLRICKKCNVVKPDRAHHCSVCNRCIYKLDHHCPWMHNCVGHGNHRYFFLFLFYLWLGCLYYCSMALIPFLDSKDVSMRKWNALNPHLTKTAITFTFVLAAAIFCALTFLMLWNFYLIITAQTTIEFYSNQYLKKQMKVQGEVYINIYNLGFWRNFKIFFNIGQRYPWWTILMPIPIPAYGDGTSYPSLRSQQPFDL